MVLHTYLIFSGFFGYICIKHFCMRIYANIKGLRFSQSEAGQIIDLIAFVNLISLISFWWLDSPTF